MPTHTQSTHDEENYYFWRDSLNDCQLLMNEEYQNFVLTEFHHQATLLWYGCGKVKYLKANHHVVMD